MIILFAGAHSLRKAARNASASCRRSPPTANTSSTPSTYPTPAALAFSTAYTTASTGSTDSARSSIPPAASSPGTAKTPASSKPFPAPTIPTTFRPPPSGAPTANTSSTPAPPRAIPIPPDYKKSNLRQRSQRNPDPIRPLQDSFQRRRGGTPEPVRGASNNGMSNNFPKVSPDGKWIVFVQCKNGLLMRPDSKLYIVPFEGGEARPLESNLPVMNSWHTFSPNGKWLAFSSKTPSFYTHLYLTHIDENGHASPPVVVENATASNRAVNIPEFANIGPRRTRSHRDSGHRLLSRVRHRPAATGRSQMGRSRIRLEGRRRQRPNRFSPLEQHGRCPRRYRQNCRRDHVLRESALHQQRQLPDPQQPRQRPC